MLNYKTVLPRYLCEYEDKMTFLDLVKKRRSVRNYSQKRIPREVIERCLEAARFAPSACNSQPWSFIVVDEPELRSELSNKAFSGIYSMNSFAKDAQALVVVVTERSRYLACLGGYFRGTQYNLVDIGIACEHFVLQATEEGLGSCLIGWFNEKAIKKCLKISRNSKVDIVIALGYPEGEAREQRRKTLDEIRRYNI